MSEPALRSEKDMMWRKAACFCFLAALLAGCSHGGQQDAEVSAMWRNVTIEAAGTLVDIGNCGVLVDAEGRRYGIVGDLSDYERGDRVTVSGPVSYWSACGTYSAIKAERVKPDRKRPGSTR